MRRIAHRTRRTREGSRSDTVTLHAPPRRGRIRGRLDETPPKKAESPPRRCGPTAAAAPFGPRRLSSPGPPKGHVQCQSAGRQPKSRFPARFHNRRQRHSPRSPRRRTPTTHHPGTRRSRPGPRRKAPTTSRQRRQPQASEISSIKNPPTTRYRNPAAEQPTSHPNRPCGPHGPSTQARTTRCGTDSQ